MHSVKSSSLLICDDEENSRHCGRSGTVLQQDAVRQTLTQLRRHEMSLGEGGTKDVRTVHVLARSQTPFYYIKTERSSFRTERCSENVEPEILIADKIHLETESFVNSQVKARA
jgi:hypothetical protein